MSPIHLMEQLLQRTECDCEKCVAGCQTAPGFLGVGDLEAINLYARGEMDPAWTREHFAASSGAKAMGEMAEIGTIVPRQRDDGTCVFLTDTPKSASAFNQLAAAQAQRMRSHGGAVASPVRDLCFDHVFGDES